MAAINLYHDTQTRPTDGMRAAVASAVVGDELILDRTAHPVNSEAGGPAQLSGLMVRVLDGDGGRFSPEQPEAAVRPPGNRYMPRSRVVSVEQTSNLGGGRVWSIETVRGVLEVASRFGLRGVALEADARWRSIRRRSRPTS